MTKVRVLMFFLTTLTFFAYRVYADPPDNDYALTLPAALSPGEARSRILAAADNYEHTPYRLGGLDGNGLDCSGLVYLSFLDALGVSIPRSAWNLFSWSEKISINDACPGDLVFFTTTGNGNITHVGIFAGDGRFIHAASEGPETGVIYSGLDERYWSRTFAGAGRLFPKADIDNYSDNKMTAELSYSGDNRYDQ